MFFFLDPFMSFARLGKHFGKMIKWIFEKVELFVELFVRKWNECQLRFQFSHRALFDWKPKKKEKHLTLFDGFFMLHETSQGFQTNASQI